MKIEVTKKEAAEIIADRWCRKHWKKVYLPLGISLILAVLYVVLVFTLPTKELSDWITIPPLFVILAPGVYFHFLRLRESGKIAEKDIDARPDKD